MIQRIQTLFLFQLILLGIALMLVPSGYLAAGGEPEEIYLLPVRNINFQSSPGHWAAIVINITGIILALLTVFLYKKRNIQRNLCFALTVLWLVLALMIAFCPFISGADTPASTTVNYYAVIIAILGSMGAMLAARFIKRDIDLLKSADRIR